MVFSCHLDVGYSNHVFGPGPLGTAVNVLNGYFNHHFRNAINISQYLASNPSLNLSYTFTFHAWVVSLYLDCPPNLDLTCPSQTERDNFIKAARAGYITWTAFPFNPQYELYDEETLGFGVELTHQVDDLVGVRRKRVLSLRDVPGFTVGALKTLRERGVKVVSGGVNSFCAPPDVGVQRPFRWRDPVSKAEVVAFWHPGWIRV
ncbi:hypothetical protein HK102_005518 [Quaeritorhiza haematococci]|nr:hypothetical protein HK102_005518 [Quaeritorhiza haematococci]